MGEIRMKNYTPAQFLAMHKAQISAPFPKVAVDLDEERFFEPGGEGEAIAAGMGYSRCYEDEMDLELVAYWASYDKGLKKEIHHGNSVWAESRKFVTYTPMSAYKAENRERRYPLMILLTGERDKPFVREGMGWCQMAAREEVLLLIPASVSEMGVLSAIREAVDDLPVDRSRIYVCGFSNGAFRTAEFSILHPDIVAACCSFGTEPYANIRWEPNDYMRCNLPDGHTTIATSQRTIPFSPQVYQVARECMVPFIHIMGCNEGPRMIPFYKPCDPEIYAFYHSSEYIVENVNRKLWINHCPQTDILAVRACKNSKNEVERIIGMPFDETHVEVHNKVHYYFGDVKSDDGVIRSRFVAVENMPHICGGAYPRIAWEFLKNFRRDEKHLDGIDPFHHVMLSAYPGRYWPMKQKIEED